MSQVKWRFEKKDIEESSILKAEEYFGITFPQDYRSVALKHNGGRPLPKAFDTETSQGKMIKTLLSLDKQDKGNIYEVHEWVKGRLPKGIVLIANDPGGNYIAFDFRDQLQNPSVVYWNMEKGQAEYVAQSFKMFLDALYE